MVLADVIKRWQVLNGRKTLLSTGTDEHGMKVQQAAAREGFAPKEFCDSNAEKFKQLAQAATIDYDFFVRTTDGDHIEAVHHFWYLLRERGYIYESKHEGWYCISDECFYPESTIERKFDPRTGKTIMASIETGNEVEWTEEKNYHFRMKDLKDKLLQFYKDNPDWILPRSRMNEVVSWVSNNLEDLSISRPVNRLDWGVRVPDDPSQTVYVWVDALINYLTKAGYPNWTPGKEHEGGWPADVHLIGKDILRFHCIYWPALLMALDLPLPKQILSHAHWTMGKKKMSKSIGNVVNPFYAIDRWGVDTMRYYLMRDGGIENDADYGNEFILKRYKSELQATIGNLLNRIARAQPSWGLDEAVKLAGTSTLPESTIGYQHMKNLRIELEKATREFATQMDSLNPASALRVLVDMIFEVRTVDLFLKVFPQRLARNLSNINMQINRFLTATAPWKLRNAPSPENAEAVSWIIYHAAEALRIAGILLQPVMPTKMGELLDVLGVEPNNRSMNDAVFGKDHTYGLPSKDLGINGHQWTTLFPPLVGTGSAREEVRNVTR
jgi:methionyl-tRNA synthetase